MAFDPISAAILGGTQLLGGMMAGNAASSAAASQAESSRYAADKQLEAARLAADAAKFRPYSITSGFGSSFFNPETQTAGYTLDPRLAAFRDQLYGVSSGALGQLAGTSAEQEAQKYYQQQMGLMAPTRAQEDVLARQQALTSGRIGLGVAPVAVGAGTAGGLVNPDEYARQLARENINRQIAATSTDYGQSMLDKLLGRGTTALTAGTGVEQLGMTPLTMGADIGNKAAVSGAQSGQLLSQGTNAAMNQLMAGTTAANQYNLAASLGSAQGLQNAGLKYAGMFQQQPASIWATPVDALDTSAYGNGLLGYQRAMADING